MTNSQIIIAVIKQFRELFLDKAELKGYDDWDAFFGCITQLENVAAKIEEEEEEKLRKETEEITEQE